MRVKLKFQVPEIFLGILMAVAVFAMGMTFQSSRHQPAQTTANQKAEKIEASNKPDPFSWDWFTADGTVFLTGVLASIAAVQAALFLWQLRYMRIGMRDATKVAMATDLSARAAIAIHLPIIRIKPTDLTWGDSFENGVRRAHCSVGFVHFKNVGKSKAFPIELLYGMTIDRPLGFKPSYKFTVPFDQDDIFEIERALPDKRLLGDFEVQSSDWSAICSNAMEVWFYCCLRYDDFMGIRHEAGFCWKWKSTGTGMAWSPDKTPAYNQRT